MAGLYGTRRSRKKSVVKPRKSSHATRVHDKKIQRTLPPIRQEDVAETKELIQEKEIPDLEKELSSPMDVLPADEPRSYEMMPELEEFNSERFRSLREYNAAGEKRARKKRRERIKKNVKKGWGELGLLEKRGLA